MGLRRTPWDSVGLRGTPGLRGVPGVRYFPLELRPTKFSIASNDQTSHQTRHQTVMLNEFSQAGLLKQLDNNTHLLMLDEADEFLQQHSAFNTLVSGRAASEKSVRCGIPKKSFSMEFSTKLYGWVTWTHCIPFVSSFVIFTNN